MPTQYRTMFWRGHIFLKVAKLCVWRRKKKKHTYSFSVLQHKSWLIFLYIPFIIHNISILSLHFILSFWTHRLNTFACTHTHTHTHTHIHIRGGFRGIRYLAAKLGTWIIPHFHGVYSYDVPRNIAISRPKMCKKKVTQQIWFSTGYWGKNRTL